jgi:hypothetical protein
MRIEFLWFDDCPNHDDARALLDAVLEERGLDVSVESVNVPDLATGERMLFPGSPTIRVNGVDVDPGYVDEGDYTPRCRVYATSEGLRGVPERGWIEAAIDTASKTARS